ncbi:hypothetical protein [Methylobacterium aerolatum]|uniref:Uncharacterized protein n=1 Tax=Methylobacterium aerolatum TaxID=418708 RepID=A0ABU0I0B4_9HYPH|nr:hypothetical protein [Methylobacterium aerolatum]MDQ0448043.1 hypothetical protein [Methylobacterium aerolatum]
MKPMKPMEPMKGAEPWWPEDLGSPASSGAQNGMKYAFFPDKQRLLVERDGSVSTYDSGDHRIGGVAQANGGSVTFTSQNGEVDLGSLKKVG